jgi:glycosyltransferase involved in cell wall biosynthesis
MSGRRVLVAASRTALNNTSEGICTFKYIQALAAAGHRVSCLTGDPSMPHERRPAWWPSAVRLRWLEDVEGTKTNVIRIARASARFGSTGPLGAYCDRKINAAGSYATGYAFHVWHRVEAWRQAIARAVEEDRPDCIIIRGAGLEFDPHMAMLEPIGASAIPWLAHYHDPYPLSLYPEPYRQRVPFVSRRQEAVHHRIIASANALSFPSSRLRDWVLRESLKPYRRKAFVVPHIASELKGCASLPDPSGAATEDLAAHRLFNVVHVGTLLRHRDPRALLRGFLDFVGQDHERSRLAKLIFVGRADAAHVQTPEWRELQEAGILDAVTRRLNYSDAMDIARRAQVLVLLEANGRESPFFPGKLADYLALRKPVLALSPERSATSDILGAEHPLRIAPDDAGSIAAALTELWKRWRNGSLGELQPSERARASASESVVQHRVEEIFDFLLPVRQWRVS